MLAARPFESRVKISRLSRLYIVFAPLLVPVFYAVVGYTDRYCSLSMHGELKFIEMATITFMLIGSIFFLRSAALWRKQEGRVHLFYLLFGLLLIAAILEETSFGQHIFGFQTPAFLSSANAQDETNLHNLLGINLLYVLYIPGLIFALLPLIRDWGPIRGLQKRGWLALPPLLVVPLLVVCSLIDLRLLISSNDIVTFTMAEVGEMMYMLGLLIMAVLAWQNLHDDGNPRTQWTGRLLAAALSLGIAAGMLISVTVLCDYPSNQAIKREVDSMLRPEDALIFVGEAQDARIFLSTAARSSDRFYVLPGDQPQASLEEIQRLHHTWLVVTFRDPDNLVQNLLIENTFPYSETWRDPVRLDRVVAVSEPQDCLVHDVLFGESIMLDCAGVSPSSKTHPGDALAVTLKWHTDETQTTSYKVFVHVYAPDGMLVAQHDAIPGSDLIPVTTWQPGQQVIDRHGLFLPDDLSPGMYRIGVGLYEPASGERLEIADPVSDDEVLILAELELD